MITKPKIDKSVLLCSGAAVVGDVTLGKHVSVWYNAVLRGDEGAIKVGDNTNIQDCAVMHEETTVGAGCTIGHGAIVHGCTVGDNVLIGSGAKVLGPFRVGDNARVAAGAVVLNEVPANATAVGVPAKIVRLNGERTGYLDQIHVSDPTAQELCALRREYLLLAKRLGESSVFPCDEELDAKEPPASE